MYSAPLQRSAAAAPGSSSSPLGCSAVEFRSKEKSAGVEIAELAEDAQRSDPALARLVAAQTLCYPQPEVVPQRSQTRHDPALRVEPPQSLLGQVSALAGAETA